MGRTQVKVLITGAAGFLGRHFVRHHLDSGDEVTGVDDLSSPHSAWPLELEPGDRAEMDAGSFFDFMEDAVRFDLAYHFAAPVGGRLKIEGDPLFNADSLRLDSLFFRWAIKNVKTAVYPSSSAVYGTSLQGKDGHALQEGMFHPANPNWLAPDEMYGFTKLAGELLAWKAAEYGLSTLCIRPFSGYGPDQSLEYPVPSIADRVARREDPLIVWGDGEQKRDFIYIDDLVWATIARLADGVQGYQCMNIGSGWGTDFLTVARTLADLAGYYPEIKADTTKPVGVQNRRSDITRMQFFYQPTITLRDGLRAVLDAREAANAR